MLPSQLLALTLLALATPAAVVILGAALVAMVARCVR